MKSNLWEDREGDVRTYFRRILVKYVWEGRWNWLIVLTSVILGDKLKHEYMSTGFNILLYR